MQSYIMNGLHVDMVTFCWLLDRFLSMQQVLDRLWVLPEVWSVGGWWIVHGLLSLQNL